MKKLKDILVNIHPLKLIGKDTVSINELKIDSRKIENGDVFFAIKGTVVDGHDFISNVIEQGAKVIVCEVFPDEINGNVTYIQVKDARKTSAIMACNFYNNPSGKLKLVGVTGTNGKTSVATLLQEIYVNKKYKSGLISTIVNKINNEDIPTSYIDLWKLEVTIKDWYKNINLSVLLGDQRTNEFTKSTNNQEFLN